MLLRQPFTPTLSRSHTFYVALLRSFSHTRRSKKNFTEKSYDLYPYPTTMSAFDLAWSLLKALPEYQSYQERYDRGLRAGYGQPTQVLQRRRGTLPPAIARIMRETQEGRQRRPRQLAGSVKYPPFPMDTRIRDPDEFEMPRHGRLEEYPVHSMEHFPDTAPISGYEESDEYAGRHAQLQRGSVFDPRPVRFRSMIEHPPKQPFDPDEAAAYLQSIGF